MATAEFAEHGFHEASVNRILRESELSKGSFYYTFEDKEDLFVTLIREHITAAFEALDAPLSPPSEGPPEGFWAWIEGLSMSLLEQLHGRVELYALGHSFYALQGRSERVERLLAEGRGWTVEVLQAGQALGAVRQDLPLELLVDAAFSLGISMDRWAARVGPMAPEREAKFMRGSLDLFRRLLAP